MVASSAGLHRYENCVNIVERLWVTRLQHPTLFPDVVFIKDSEIEGLLLVWPTAPPRLECARILDSGLCVQVVCIENQPLPFRVENATIRLAGLSIAIHIVDFRDIKIASSHQVSNITIVVEQVLLLRDLGFFLIEFA